MPNFGKTFYLRIAGHSSTSAESRSDSYNIYPEHKSKYTEIALKWKY